MAQAYRTLNRILTAAVDDELLGRNPLRGVKPPQTKSEPMRFLSHEDVAALAAAIDRPSVPRFRARRRRHRFASGGAELIGLRRRPVDLLRRTITVVEQVRYIGDRHQTLPPKSAAGRRAVSVPGVVVAAVEEHLAAYSEPGLDGLVFPAPEGGYLRLENFRKRVWQPATLAAGVAPFRIHDLRHTCASLAIAAGADVKVLQRMLGHASAALTLDRYVHLLPGQARTGGEPPGRDGPGRGAREARRRRRAGFVRGISAGWNGGSLTTLNDSMPLTSSDEVARTGVDPVTSRFSGARSAN